MSETNAENETQNEDVPTAGSDDPGPHASGDEYADLTGPENEPTQRPATEDDQNKDQDNDQDNGPDGP